MKKLMKDLNRAINELIQDIFFPNDELEDIFDEEEIDIPTLML